MPNTGGTPCDARAAVHLGGMSDPQSQIYAAMKDAQRADKKKRAVGEALRTRQLEYETAKLRGRQQRINRARAALEAAQLAYDAAHVCPRPGVEIALLFNDSREQVRMERWAPNTSVALDLPDGGEFLVLDGDFDEGGEHFVLQSWLRLPPQGRLDATAGRRGCRLWVKTGHLRHIQVPPRTEE